jgi:S1-C subfamily serine protease
MAERVAEYLSAHPDKALVILAGSGHVEFGSGISNRVRRRLPGLRMTVLVTADKPQSKPDLVDYTLVSRKQALPAAPKMGIALDRSDGVRVKGVTPGGPAAHSGIKPNDHIVALEGVDIKSTGDVRLALLDKKPGDHVLIQVRRQDAAGTQDLRFEITLQ